MKADEKIYEQEYQRRKEAKRKGICPHCHMKISSCICDEAFNNSKT
jgi:hypothetical protein